MMNRTLEDYLALPYTLEIIPDGEAWFVSVKELSGCMTEVDEWNQIFQQLMKQSIFGLSWHSNAADQFLNRWEFRRA